MTPIMLSKRWVKKLNQPLPHTGHTHSGTHPMGWISTQYPVPSTLLYSWPSDAPTKLLLRSSFTISVNQLDAQHSSHKQCQTESAQYWLNISDVPIQLQYTDPRSMTEHTTEWQPYTSFILSSAHSHSVHNHSEQPVTWISIHTGWNWHSTAKHYQHQW